MINNDDPKRILTALDSLEKDLTAFLNSVQGLKSFIESRDYSSEKDNIKNILQGRQTMIKSAVGDVLENLG